MGHSHQRLFREKLIQRKIRRPAESNPCYDVPGVGQRATREIEQCASIRLPTDCPVSTSVTQWKSERPSLEADAGTVPCEVAWLPTSPVTAASIRSGRSGVPDASRTGHCQSAIVLEEVALPEDIGADDYAGAESIRRARCYSRFKRVDRRPSVVERVLFTMRSGPAGFARPRRTENIWGRRSQMPQLMQELFVLFTSPVSTRNS
jgi:hypothetical protein